MKKKLEIIFLKDIPDNQKLSKHLNEMDKSNNEDELISEKLYITYNYNYHNMALNPNEKIELGTYSSLDPNNVSKTQSKNPALMLYNINSSLEKNVVNYNKEIINISKNCLLKYALNNFYIIGSGNTLNICHLDKTGLLYFFNFDFIITKIINTKKIKRIVLRKKGDLIFQYDEKKHNKIISLLNPANRFCFLNEIVNSNPNIQIEDIKLEVCFNSNEREFQKRFLIEIFSRKDIDSNYYKFNILKKMKELLMDELPNSYYHYKLSYNGVTTYLSHLTNLENGKFGKNNTSKVCLLPYFYNYSLINEVFYQMFFSMPIRLKIDTTEDEDYNNYLEMLEFKQKQEVRKEKEKKKIKQDNEKLKGLRNRPRKEIERLRKRKSGKCVYKNIIFKVCSSKSGNFQKYAKDIELSMGTITYKNKVRF